MKKRPIALITGVFLLVLSVFLLTKAAGMPCLMLLGALFLFGTVLFVKNKKVRPLLLFYITFASAVTFASLRVSGMENRVKEYASAEFLTVRFEVTESVSDFGDYDVRVTEVAGQRVNGFGARLSLPDVQDGMICETNIAFSIPQNTPSFDTRTYLKSKQIFLEGELYADDKGNAELLILSQKENTSIFVRTREAIRKVFVRYVSVEEEPLLSAVFLSDRGGISSALSRSLRSSGAMHLVTVSGSHFTVLSSALVLLLRKLRFRKKMAHLLSLPFVLFYLFLVGSSPAVMRAGLMDIYVIFAVLLGRRVDFLTNLSLSALIQIFLNPFVVVSASFQLSYVAVLTLFLARPLTRKFLLLCIPRILDFKSFYKICESFVSGVWIAVVLFPLYLFYFGEISLIAPFTNLILAPLMAPILLLAVGLCFMSVFPQARLFTRLLGVVLRALLKLFIWSVTKLGSVSFASLYLPKQVIACFAGAVMFCFVLWILWFRYQPRYRMQAPVILAMIVFLVSTISVVQIEAKKVHFFAVNTSKSSSFTLFGDGMAVVVLDEAYRTDGKRILEYLENHGVQEVDIMFLTEENASIARSYETLATNLFIRETIAPTGFVVGGETTMFVNHGAYIYGNSSILFEDGNIEIKREQMMLSYGETAVSRGVSLLKDEGKSYKIHFSSGEDYYIFADEYGTIELEYQNGEWKAVEALYDSKNASRDESDDENKGDKPVFHHWKRAISQNFF